MSQILQQPSLLEAQTRSRNANPKSSLLEATSEKATIALIRKTLCPQSVNTYSSGTPPPLPDLLPPLTSSNELDLQLYALIAIIIKEFVYGWYSKITPDHVFVDEVVQIIAHSTRALEERCRQLDVAQLVLDEIPRLVEAHIIAYRIAREGSHSLSLPISGHEIYHTLNQHPALSPVPDPSAPQTSGEQGSNETTYQYLLAQSVLAVLLPTEDLENTSLRTLVSDILADRILENEVAKKLCHGPFLWEMTSRLISLVKGREAIASKPRAAESIHPNRLERFGLLPAKEEPLNHDSPAKNQSHIALWMWRILQAFYLGYVTCRFVIRELLLVTPLVPSNPSSELSESPIYVAPVERLDQPSPSVRKGDPKKPVLKYKIFSMIAQLVNTPQRMPWLQALLSLFQHLALFGPGKVGETDNIIDRLLREMTRKYVLTPDFIPTILIAVRSSLFPMNALPESGVTSTSDTIRVSSKFGSSSPSSAALLYPSSPDASNFKVETKLAYPKAYPSQATVIVPCGPTVATAHLETTTSSNSSPLTMDYNKNNISKDDENNDDDKEIIKAKNNGSVESDHQIDAPETYVASRSPSAAPATIKEQCARDILSLIPRPIARVFFNITADDIASETAIALAATPKVTTSTTTTTCYLANKEEKNPPGQGQQPTGDKREARRGVPVQTAADLVDQCSPGSNHEIETSLLLRAIEHDILDPFADTYCNKHLIFSIIETVLVRLLPELSEHSLTELMEERGMAF